MLIHKCIFIWNYKWNHNDSFTSNTRGNLENQSHKRHKLLGNAPGKALEGKPIERVNFIVDSQKMSLQQIFPTINTLLISKIVPFHHLDLCARLLKICVWLPVWLVQLVWCELETIISLIICALMPQFLYNDSTSMILSTDDTRQDTPTHP